MKQMLKKTLVLIVALFAITATVSAKAYVGWDIKKKTLLFFCSDAELTRGSSFKGYTFYMIYGGVDNLRDGSCPWRSHTSAAERIIIDPSFQEARPIRCESWFSAAPSENEKVKKIEGLEYLNTSNATDLECMFSQLLNLQELDLSHFDTSKVTLTSSMFAGCRSLVSINLSSFDTSQVKMMSSMFNGCSMLTAIDLSSFETGMVIDTQYMFAECSNLKTIYVSKSWDTRSRSVQAYHMFDECVNLVGGAGAKYDAKEWRNRHDDFGENGYFTLKD